MPTLSAERIRELLEPYVAAAGADATLSDELVGQLSTYLDLLVRWNAKVSLTAIRQPEEMVQRHFGESLFTGLQLAGRLRGGAELLDYGSGAGFPGLPIQLLLPKIRVTLAESQARKVAFLREVIRVLGLTTQVWPRRVEEMPDPRRFDAVTVRAVDRMAISLNEAAGILLEDGWLAGLVGRDVDGVGAEEFAMPGSEHRRLLLWPNVPRGTSDRKPER
jgi:16S rRNA (guanine527-N7)-methyltransferase